MDLFYLLRPTVYGQFGPGTILDRSVHPPIVRRLNYVLDTVPPDDLHKSFPCYLVSGALGRRLREKEFSGFVLEDVRVSLDAQYQERHPDTKVPELFFLRISGRAQVDDVGLDEHHRLVVSESALGTFREFRLGACKIHKVDEAPTPEQEEEEVWEEARQRVEEARRRKR